MMTNPEVRKPRCRHISKIGARCHADVQTGKFYCFFHDPDQKSKPPQVQKEARKEVRKEARNEGGEARSREADTLTMPPGLAAIPLETPSDVAKLLAETVNLFRCRKIDLRAAKAIANIANLLLRSMKEAAQQEYVLSGQAGHPENDLRQTMIGTTTADPYSVLDSQDNPEDKKHQSRSSSVA
ncbi:MAG TPA: hypothetical protein VK738_13055 [Terriglobales bacterium]|jgi:hypothetical protein|nr:hypothetical protein [Terriglobales bacterium]